nr:BACON domain-containing protein [Prevotella sp.]
MKKIYLFIFAMGCLGLASCSDDDYSPAVHGLEVTSAETSIEAVGGTKTIATAVNGTVSAYANDSWLNVSVDGSNVNVTASQNNSAESRNTTVVIKSTPEDSAIVNISQFGAVFQLSAGSSLVIPSNLKYSKSYFMKHNLDVATSTSADWISVNTSSDSLTVNLSKNTTGHLRKGYIYYQMGDIRDSISVKQYDFDDDFAGIYFLVYKSSKGKKVALYAQVTSDTLEITDLNTIDLKIPVTFNPSTATMSIGAGSYCGTYSPYYLYNCFVDGTGKNWTAYETGYYGTLPFDYDDKNGTSAILGGAFGSNEIANMYIRACTAKAFNSDTDQGSLFAFISPYIIKYNAVSAKTLNAKGVSLNAKGINLNAKE